MPENPTNIYERFAPSKLWYSAREEIFFGSGTYTMRLDNEQQALLVTRRWATYLLQHEQGMAFEVNQDGPRVRVFLSPVGSNAINKAGYTYDELQFIGMNTATKADFLERFEAVIKEQL